MGNFMPSLPFVGGKGLKRKSSEDDLLDDDEYAASGKRRKLATTSSYIFKALYQEGQNSDITINALGFQWNLHRVYLCQSAYFASMFGGAWRETNAEEVEIEINNPNITKEALDIVFGSFYQDEIEIDPDIVIEVMAAATLFQLQTVINQTKEIISNSISAENVLKFHRITFDYGYIDLSNLCFEWLELNLLGCISEDPDKLREISLELLIKLLSSIDLYVNQTEFATYSIAKMWIFLNKNPKWTGTKDGCIASVYRYFRTQPDGCYLESTEGEQFEPLFKVVRHQYLIGQHFDMEIIEKDRIIPQQWLNSCYQMQWYQMLRLEQGVDKGPKRLSDDVFYKHCFRCGRTLLNDAYHNWRWSGYNFGLDLTVTFERKTLRFRRNHRHSPDYQSSLSVIARRQIMCRITATSIGNRRQKVSFGTSGIMNLNIGKNEEIQVLKLPDTANFPILLSANFLVFSPAKTPAEAKIDAVNFT